MNLELFQRLVSINSVYPAEGRLGRFLKTYLSGLGFNVTVIPVATGRFNLFATRGRSPKLLFYAHLDTAPTEKLPGWKTPPTHLTPVGDRLYGLGAYDMKGGLFAFLEAVKNTPADVKIFLAVDEENISAGAWQAVNYQTSFFSGVKLIISAEPNFGLGDESVTSGRTGRYVFLLEFHGQAVHLARQTTGVDAIALAGAFIDRFYKSKYRLFSDPHTVSQIRKISAESVGMSVCAEAAVEVEVLSGPKDTPEGIMAKLHNLSQVSVSLNPRATPYLSGYQFNRFPHSGKLGQIIRRHTGKPMKVVFRSSVADDNVLATLGIPVITWGPSGGNAHAANEYIDRSSLQIFILMYSDLLTLYK